MRFYRTVLLLLLLLPGCTTKKGDTVFQVSTLDALVTGVYDGSVTCRSLLRQGNLGTGTFDALDGEMLILGNKVYQVKADGKVYQPDPSTLTPFATVCHFNSEISFRVDSISDLAMMERFIDEYADNPNLFCAIKITGVFSRMRTRSVPRQVKPYPTLTVVAANQPEFLMENISGTVIGFRYPPFAKGISLPGYHLHFISSDLSRGGHILEFELLRGNCEIDMLHQLLLKLPEKDSAFAATDLGKDRSLELRQVEGVKNHNQ